MAPLPRRSSSRTGGLGRIGRGGAGGRQSKAEFDAALTAKLERLAVSMEATDSGKEGAVSEAVVEMATPDGKSQQNGTRRGVSVEATTHPGDAVADWAPGAASGAGASRRKSDHMSRTARAARFSRNTKRKTSLYLPAERARVLREERPAVKTGPAL